jgi:tRNA (guanine-N7-)-methyltransferase
LGKNKLSRWAEMEDYNHVIQPPFEEVFRKDHKLKGKWNSDFFRNNNPIVLELGCGKGEYTTGMARKYPEKNFLGVDIKGSRMWRGAKQAKNENLVNVGFLRTRIELIESFFSKDEISEIWITFPDPQLKKRRVKKRLTGSRFLNHYRTFLKKDGIIHLKTDSAELYEYTISLLKHNNLQPVSFTDDLYSDGGNEELLSIKTHYEQLFLNEGKKITYLKFNPGKNTVKEPQTEDE